MGKKTDLEQCPDHQERIGFRRRLGEEKAALLFFWLKWGSVAAAAILIFLFSWNAFKSGVSSAVDAITPDVPCMFDSEKDCGRWAHPTQWFGSDADTASEAVQHTSVAAPAEPAVMPASDSEPALAKEGCGWSAVCRWKKFRGTDGD